MPTFILTGRFTQSAIRGPVAKPKDRSGVIARLVGAAGGKMLAYYVTTGDTETRQAWRCGEFAEIAKTAGSIGGAYTPPG